MSLRTLERRCQDAFARTAALRLETERVRERLDVLCRSSRALQADLERVLAETRVELRKGAAVRHEMEADIRRRQVDRVIERVIEVFGAQGKFAFRWDTMSDPSIIFLPWDADRASGYVQ